MAVELINATFDAFVQFAQTQEAAGKGKAVARFDPGELGGIVNRTIKPASGDWVGVGAGRLARPHSVERAADALPDDFKLDVKVDVSFSINVDRLADLV